MENEALVSCRDYPAQRRALERILEKLSEVDLPGVCFHYPVGKSILTF